MAAYQLRNCEQSVVASVADIRKEILGGFAVEFREIEVARADLKAAYCFEQALLYRSSYRHDLARRLHLRAELI